MQYHLNDLTDNACVEMYGQIRQFVADLPDVPINENEIQLLLAMYEKDFDDSAYIFLRKSLREEILI